MARFPEVLIRARKEMGFRSALGFYRYLAERDGIVVQYPQYKRIESGKILAQPELVRRIAKVLPEYSKLLVHAYCSDVFPEEFELPEIPLPKDPRAESAATPPTGLLRDQEELNPRQVAAIARSPLHYAAYLLFTLARKPVSLDEAKGSIEGLNDEVLTDLEKSKVVRKTEGGYKARIVERRFPDADSPALTEAYRRLDEWDVSLGGVFRLRLRTEKSIFRRISPRYLPILLKQAEALIEQSRASDEVDPAQNTEVLSLVLRIQNGKIPG